MFHQVSEEEAIDNFRTHRAAYERLRIMLQEEQELRSVSQSDIQKHLGDRDISNGSPLNDRYNEYLALLRQTGARQAFRKQRIECGSEQGTTPDVIIGGDRTHATLLWTNQEPANQVASLEDYYETPGPHRHAHRRLEGNWYLSVKWYAEVAEVPDRAATEKEMLDSFHAHRTAFERLRVMLQEDQQVYTVSDQSTEIKQWYLQHSTGPGRPIDRYNEYLALLKQACADSAHRQEGPHSNMSIVGNRWQQAAVVWMNEEPVGQVVASLADYSRTPGPHHTVYRCLEGNWYLGANW